VTKKDPHESVEGALHEVSNALTVLLGWIAEARDPSASPDDVKHALRIVEERARVARNLARRAIGARVPDLGDATLETVLRTVEETLELEVERAGMKLRLSQNGTAVLPVAEDVVPILTNLVLNALAHAPRGGTIALEAVAEATRVVIDVADEGPGVGAERAERIFEGESTRDGGAGIGLRHARAVARAAGGDLALVRELGGAGGARFRLTWPRAVENKAPPRSVPRLRVLEGLRVLVVEDDRDVTELLQSALEARGATVTSTRDEAEFFAALAGGGKDVDVVLADLSPIARDPGGALARVRAAAPGARFVLVTGSTDRVPDEILGAGHGATECVRKPFEVKEIVDLLLTPRGKP
jgi:CheY-like chemotaxis protein/anti-sigma regulatory factor (Ser/Thr protein kinase)